MSSDHKRKGCKVSCHTVTAHRLITLFLCFPLSLLQHRDISQTKIRVISTLLFVLFGCLLFVVLPAAIFKHIEGWSALEAIYFVVITLTTIGFGDFVTGTNTKTAQTNTVSLHNTCICPQIHCYDSAWHIKVIVSVSVSRRIRNRVLRLLQTTCIVLDSAGTCLLCCHPQHDRRLAQSHLQKNKRRGMRLFISFAPLLISFATPLFHFFLPLPMCLFIPQCIFPPSSSLDLFFCLYQHSNTQVVFSYLLFKLLPSA